MKAHPFKDRSSLTPKDALDYLIEGNERFINSEFKDKDVATLLSNTRETQYPFAATLSCADSRAPVELLFDQALGDVFSVRLAGNIASDKAIGSLEYSSKYLGSKILVVMGHTGCGAVKAACDDFKDGHIGEIINLIKPSIRHETTTLNKDERNSKNADFVQKVCELNVRYQIDQIMRTSDIIEDMVASHELGVIGAVYDLASGRVNFMQDTFIS